MWNHLPAREIAWNDKRKDDDWAEQIEYGIGQHKHVHQSPQLFVSGKYEQQEGVEKHRQHEYEYAVDADESQLVAFDWRERVEFETRRIHQQLYLFGSERFETIKFGLNNNKIDLTLNYIIKKIPDMNWLE